MKMILVPTNFSSNAGKAQKQGIDLLAIVTHKRTFMESIFSGSKTKKMCYHTSIPLLAIPAVKQITL